MLRMCGVIENRELLAVGTLNNSVRFREKAESTFRNKHNLVILHRHKLCNWLVCDLLRGRPIRYHVYYTVLH